MTEIQALEQEILAKKKRLAELRKQQPATLVDDHEFQTDNGVVRLSELFGGNPDLILINNMGEDCRFCTLWADGFNGVVPELESRAAFVLVSADSPERHYRFKKERGWRFQSVTDPDGKFRRAVGFCDPDGDTLPMAAGFHKDSGGTIRLIASTQLGEGDDFCATWHLLNLLKDGWNGWAPNNR